MLPTVLCCPPNPHLEAHTLLLPAGWVVLQVCKIFNHRWSFGLPLVFPLSLIENCAEDCSLKFRWKNGKNSTLCPLRLVLETLALEAENTSGLGCKVFLMSIKCKMLIKMDCSSLLEPPLIATLSYGALFRDCRLSWCSLKILLAINSGHTENGSGVLGLIAFIGCYYQHQTSKILLRKSLYM